MHTQSSHLFNRYDVFFISCDIYIFVVELFRIHIAIQNFYILQLFIHLCLLDRIIFLLTRSNFALFTRLNITYFLDPVNFYSIESCLLDRIRFFFATRSNSIFYSIEYQDSYSNTWYSGVQNTLSTQALDTFFRNLL